MHQSGEGDAQADRTTDQGEGGEWKEILQARLDKQERAQSTRGKMLLEWFVLEQLERNGQCGHREGLRQ